MSEEAQTYKIFITEEGVEKDLTRVDIVELLYNDVATVTFTKKDGTERVMECTLHKEILKSRLPIEAYYEGNCRADILSETFLATGEPFPPGYEVSSQVVLENPTEVTKEPNPNIIAVFDLWKQDWRSFRVDSVKSIGFPKTIYTDSGTVYPTITGKTDEGEIDRVENPIPPFFTAPQPS